MLIKVVVDAHRLAHMEYWVEASKIDNPDSSSLTYSTPIIIIIMIDPPFWSQWWSSSSPPQRSPSLRRCDSVSTWWKGGDVSHQWDLTRTQDANQKLHNVQHLTARLWRNFCKTAKHKMRENHHAVLFCLFWGFFQFCILCTCLCLSMSMSRSGVLLMSESGDFLCQIWIDCTESGLNRSTGFQNCEIVI